MLADLDICNIAIFVDYENVARQNGHCLSSILSQVGAAGTIVRRRAYANWNKFSSHRIRLQADGFELIEVPSNNGKNSADIKLTVDVLETAFTMDFIDAFVIVSGDSDFVSLVVKLNELNRRAWLYVTSSQANNILEKFCYRLTLADVAKTEHRRAGGPANPKPNDPAKKARLTTAASDQLRKIEISAAVLTTIYWAIRACEATSSAPHLLNHLFAAAKVLDASFDPGKLVDSPKRRRIRLARYLHDRGIIELNFDRKRNEYRFQAGKKLATAVSPSGPPVNFNSATEELETRIRRTKLPAAFIASRSKPRLIQSRQLCLTFEMEA